MHKHRIILEHFELEEGKISFSKLRELQDRLTALAEGAVLNLVEGRSKPGRGKKPQWVHTMLDFQLTNLNAGSTILELEAPEIEEVYQNKQFALFEGPEAESLLRESAFGLACYVIDKATKEPQTTGLLDKYILQQIMAFEKLLDNENSQISLVSNGQSKVQETKIKYESLKQISITEKKIPESVKITVTGVLDVMRHQKEQMEVVTDAGQRIRAFPGKNYSIKKLKNHFGENVKIVGLAHFKADRTMKFLEILNIQKADAEEKTAEELTLPIFEDLDLKRLAKGQSWSGFDEKKFRKTIQELDVEESSEELLSLLKE
jgi:hypothetical protein